MHRLKSHLLTKENNRWYYQNNLYTGVIFFDKEDCIVEPFYVVNGIITEKYHPICQGDLPSPIQIDLTTFDKRILYSDCEDTDFIPQMYQNKKYSGIGYSFVNGICNYEALFGYGGTQRQIEWDNNRQINLIDYALMDVDTYLSTDRHPNSYIQFINQFDGYYFCYDMGDEKLSVKFSNSYVTSLSAQGTKLLTDFSMLPLEIPEITKLFSKKIRFPMSKEIILWISDLINQKTIKSLATQGSFEITEIITLQDVVNLDDLRLFQNNALFPKLKKVCFSRYDISENPIKINKLINDFEQQESIVKICVD